MTAANKPKLLDFVTAPGLQFVGAAARGEA